MHREADTDKQRSCKHNAFVPLLCPHTLFVCSPSCDHMCPALLPPRWLRAARATGSQRISLGCDCRVGKQIVNVPSFLVRVDSQKHIDFALKSPFGGGRPGRVKRRNLKCAPFLNIVHVQGPHMARLAPLCNFAMSSSPDG